jgi:hypothetical protein
MSFSFQPNQLAIWVTLGLAAVVSYVYSYAIIVWVLRALSLPAAEGWLEAALLVPVLLCTSFLYSNRTPIEKERIVTDLKTGEKFVLPAIYGFFDFRVEYWLFSFVVLFLLSSQLI